MSELNSSDTLSPRESGRFIASRSKHVRINTAAVNRVVDLIHGDPSMRSSDTESQQYADHPTHPPQDHPLVVDWVFLLSTLNFSFWTEAGCEKYQVTYGGRPYTGYYALCAAIRRAMDECDVFVSPRHYGAIASDRLAAVLRSDSGASIPLLQQRVEALHEASRVLIAKYDGSFFGCLKAASGSALRLVQLIVADFESFGDRAVYCDRSVAFYKRAQIAVSDLYACCSRSVPLCQFADIDRLTMFADYRVPQVLHQLGVLVYSDELLELLHSDSQLPNGSLMEVEIRGCSIEAVERIVDAVNAGSIAASNQGNSGSDDGNSGTDHCTGTGTTTTVNSASVDYFLWLYRRRFNDQIVSPYHKTRCIYY